MSIALSAFPGILAPIQGFVQWLSGGSRPASRSSTGFTTNPIATRAYPARAEVTISSKPAPVARPSSRLRVVRVMEAGQTPTQVGRMVISGRMADVCAELDRLAACSGSSA
ncbi:MAG TPA: hypothetical protein PK497_05735 [Burkholderiaceae bacterium]|jgi:hypothetical protein|nr:hypothetical protein [Burkholderiaceae bacterium]HPH13577.1 hypothetical protein [Burkholderiaceae bacterium]